MATKLMNCEEEETRRKKKKILIIGGGVFGLSAAISLRTRGHEVVVLERQSSIPAEGGSSVDMNRIIRADYGNDSFYTKFARHALDGWKAWNVQRLGEGKDPLFHQTGLLVLSRTAFAHGEYEYESFKQLRDASINVVRLNEPGKLGEMFPAWRGTQTYADGYYNPEAGWADAAGTVKWLVQKASSLGVVFHTGEEGECVALLHGEAGQVIGVATKNNLKHHADVTLIAAGAWSPSLVPELQNVITAVGQPVVYFSIPREAEGRFTGHVFPPVLADIKRTGMYGFPARHGVLKFGIHGNGFINPTPTFNITSTTASFASKTHVCSVPAAQQHAPDTAATKITEFMRSTFVDLCQAPQVTQSKLCWYCDSFDGYFYVDHVPGRLGLIACTGGSGHGFKFAPVLGDVAADLVEGVPNEYGARFRWRERGPSKEESCRMKDSDPEVLPLQSKL